MATDDPISLREYARINGCDDKIIRRAIESGKIPPEAVVTNKENGRPMVIQAIADKSWGSLYREKKGIGQLPDVPTKVEKPQSIKQTRQKKAVQSAPELPEEQLPSQHVPIQKTTRNSKNISWSEAEREIKLLEIEIKQVNLAKLKGELVSRDIITRTFFEAGKIIKEGIMAIPDRIIDEIRVCDSRSEAHSLMSTALSTALESLSKVPEFRS